MLYPYYWIYFSTETLNRSLVSIWVICTALIVFIIQLYTHITILFMPIQSTKPKSEQFLHKRLVRQSIVALTNAFICAWSEYRVYFSPRWIFVCVSLSLFLSLSMCVCVRTLLFSFQSLETDVDVRACVCAIISLFISCWSLAAPKTWKKMDKSVFANVLLRQRQLYWFIWLFVCCCSRVCILWPWTPSVAFYLSNRWYRFQLILNNEWVRVSIFSHFIFFIKP